VTSSVGMTFAIKSYSFRLNTTDIQLLVSSGITRAVITGGY
jgi:hypothetical protein